MGKGQRTKGHDYERKMANFYRGMGYDVRRGAQAHEAMEADICGRTEGSFPFWIECAHYAKGGLVFRKYKQAKRDSLSVKSNKPIVVHVHETNGEDLVVVSLEEWGKILVLTRDR